MANKKKLLRKLFREKMPRDFSKRELDQLLSLCNCEKEQGGRGSGIRYIHKPTGRILSFDEPHGENLYLYHIKDTKKFLKSIGEEEDFE